MGNIMSVTARPIPQTIAATPSTPPEGPPRVNFPLPQELRDMIYGFLLDAGHGIAPPDCDTSAACAAVTGPLVTSHSLKISTAHKYEFHTSILAVNKEISVEAKKIFMKNTFIVVEAKWPKLTDTLRRLDVPIVCEGVERSRMALPYSPLVFSPNHPEEQEDTHKEGFVIAGRDVPILCRCMQWIFSQLPASYTVTFAGNDDTEETYTIDIGDGTAEVVKTDISISDWTRAMIPVESIIPEIKAISSPGQQVKVYTGHPPSYHQSASDAMEATMSQRTSDLPLFLCDHLQSLLLMRQAADKTAQNGIWGQKRAIARYTDIVDTWKAWNIIDACSENAAIVGQAKDTLHVMLQLVSDAASTAGELQMKLDGVDTVDHLRSSYMVCQLDAIRLAGCPHGPPCNHTFIPGSHLLMVSALLKYGTRQAITNVKRALEEALALLEMLGEMVADSRQRVLHDLAFVNRVLNDPDLLKQCADRDYEVWKALSCFCFPARVIDSGILENFGPWLEWYEATA